MKLATDGNQLLSYELTDEETIQGQILNDYQRAMIQNQVFMVANEILALQYEPLNPHMFGLAQAHKQGQLEALRYQLTSSEFAIEQQKKALVINQ